LVWTFEAFDVQKPKSDILSAQGGQKEFKKSQKSPAKNPNGLFGIPFASFASFRALRVRQSEWRPKPTVPPPTATRNPAVTPQQPMAAGR
jgi:hypothetical protein